MGRASLGSLLPLVVALFAATACPAPKKAAQPEVEAAPAPPSLPTASAPADALPPQKGGEIPAGGTCITVEAASAVALFSSGREHDCPRRLDRTMSGEKDWPRVFQSLGVVALNTAGTVRAQAERKDGACCYDVRAPRPDDAPK